MKPALLVLTVALLLTGCNTYMGSEVVPAGPDTYTCSAGGGLGWTTSPAPVRASVYRSANDFCIKRGLVMVPVSTDEHPGVYGQHMASFELVFRAVPPGDPEIKRPASEKPDTIQRIQSR